MERGVTKLTNMKNNSSSYLSELTNNLFSQLHSVITFSCHPRLDRGSPVHKTALLWTEVGFLLLRAFTGVFLWDSRVKQVALQVSGRPMGTHGGKRK